jgi:hypothetical protein
MPIDMFYFYSPSDNLAVIEYQKDLIIAEKSRYHGSNHVRSDWSTQTRLPECVHRCNTVITGGLEQTVEEDKS